MPTQINGSTGVSKVQDGVVTQADLAWVIGEYIAQDNTAASISLVTATPKTIAQITLTPGDWDVSGYVTFSPAATTNTTQESVAISLTTDALSADSTRLPHAAHVPNATTRMATPVKRLSVTVPTVVYLTAQCNFTVSTVTSAGYLQARRAA